MSILRVHAQDTTIKFRIDTSFLNFYSTFLESRYQPRFNFIYHLPAKKDEIFYKRYKSLINQQPTKSNYQLYFSLACSLWDLEKIADAEKMFLTIVNSKENYYSSTYYHSSDIPGDKTKNIYGYGSFTSNYKNYSAIYLTKIYLEQKHFAKALQYLEDAVNNYKVTYSCGTGFRRQQDEYDFLYASCYEGLSFHSKVLDLLLPSCLDRSDEIIITAIKNTYSKEEIKSGLKEAEASIDCSLDTSQSYSYQTTYSGTKKEKTDTIRYFSGSATITLFEHQINMPVPYLENDERLTKEHFIKLFKESDFYMRLNANP